MTPNGHAPKCPTDRSACRTAQTVEDEGNTDDLPYTLDQKSAGRFSTSSGTRLSVDQLYTEEVQSHLLSTLPQIRKEALLCPE